MKTEQLCVYRDERMFAAWPFSHGLWTYDDGEVVAGFTRARCSYAGLHDVQHDVLDPRSEQVTIRSADFGRTWQAESLAITATHDDLERDWLAGRIEPIPTGAAPDWSAGDFCLTTGFSVPPRRFQSAGYLQYSHDRGRSWQGPHAVPSLGFGHLQVKPQHVVRPDGTILLFVTVARNIQPAQAVHYGKFSRRFVAVYASADGGTSWRYLSSITRTGADASWIEGYYASPAQFKDGRIVVALRCQLDGDNAWPEIYQSDDGGWSWTFVSRLADWGAPTSLLALRDGRLVAVYGRRARPFGIRARVSETQGGTWGPEIVLRDDAGSGDIGYPCAAELPDGSVISTYYFNDADDTVDLDGGVRYIAATIFAP